MIENRIHWFDEDVIFDVSIKLTSASELSLFSIETDSSLIHCLWSIQFNLNSICSTDKVSIMIFDSEIIQCSVCSTDKVSIMISDSEVV